MPDGEDRAHPPENFASDGLGDWRIRGITTVTSSSDPRIPVGWIVANIDEAKGKRGQTYQYHLPSAVALDLDAALKASNRAQDLSDRFYVISNQRHAGKIDIGDELTLFNYFEDCMIAVLMSFSSLEAFANEIIGDSGADSLTCFRDGQEVGLSLSEAQRSLSLDEKLSAVLPLLKARPSPKGLALWGRFQKLKRLRDRLVHLKSHDANKRLEVNQTVFAALLLEDPITFVGTAFDLMAHFYEPKDRPRWLHHLAEKSAFAPRRRRLQTTHSV